MYLFVSVISLLYNKRIKRGTIEYRDYNQSTDGLRIISVFISKSSINNGIEVFFFILSNGFF